MGEITTEKYMVATICITFNQAQFIKDTLNGFAIQETSFPVVSLIVDDASTDGESAVIKSFMDANFNKPFIEDETDDYQLVCADHKINTNCRFVVIFLKNNHYSLKKDKLPYLMEWLKNTKYIAFCEGDDYWTKPNKLQKQVDYIEAHPGFVVCSTGYEDHYLSTSYVEDRTIKKDNGIIEFGIKDWTQWPNMKTLTMMVNKDIYMNYIRERKKYDNPKDIYLQYHILRQGKGIYICENMGVYNCNSGGVWSGLTNEEKLLWDYNSYKELYYKNDCEEYARRRLISYLGAVISYPNCKINRIEAIKEFVGLIRRGEDVLRLVRDISCFLLRKLF